MQIPAGLKYTTDHEWIKVEGNTAWIGITDFAQSELGDIVFLDIDPNLSSISKGDSFGNIEAVKTVGTLYAPCSGTVLEINTTLNDNPETINSDPYGDGWLIKIEITDASGLEKLMDDAEYKKQVGA
ncbi:MAG: glycine cleavage system protein GcvH [Ignavibacteriaceae bacterium]|nr:glycine cleavage system protein GcvH [Ignavibacteriaceae bacterium]